MTGDAGADATDNPLDVESAANSSSAGDQHVNEFSRDDSKSSREVFAKLTETPSNWHQTVVFGLVADAPEDAILKNRVSFQFGMGAIMVLCQVCSLRVFVM